MRYPLSSFFLRADVAHRSKAAHIARSSPHQVVGIHHAKRFDVDEILYQHCVKKLLVGYLAEAVAVRAKPDVYGIVRQQKRGPLVLKALSELHHSIYAAETSARNLGENLLRPAEQFIAV